MILAHHIKSLVQQASVALGRIIDGHPLHGDFERIRQAHDVVMVERFRMKIRGADDRVLPKLEYELLLVGYFGIGHDLKMARIEQARDFVDAVLAGKVKDRPDVRVREGE